MGQRLLKCCDDIRWLGYVRAWWGTALLKRKWWWCYFVSEWGGFHSVLAQDREAEHIHQSVKCVDMALNSPHQTNYFSNYYALASTNPNRQMSLFSDASRSLGNVNKKRERKLCAKRLTEYRLQHHRWHPLSLSPRLQAQSSWQGPNEHLMESKELIGSD